MKIPRIGQAVSQRDKARAALSRAVDEARRLGRPKLPSVVTLARGAGVSHVTMQACIRDGARAGVLRTRRGSGVYLAGVPQEPRSASRKRWQQIAEQVHRDVTEGVYGRGSVLPTAKELTLKYRVCHTTLRRALQHLVGQGLLERDRRGYRVSRLPGEGARSRVIGVTIGTPQQAIARPTQRHADDLRSMETACTQAGLRIDLVFFWYEGEEQVPVTPGGLEFTPEELESILGFVVYTRGLTDTTVDRILGRLSGYRRPVAVHDDTGLAMRRPDPIPLPDIRVFAFANSSLAGVEMGKVVAGLGHRAVAYIGPDGAEWSRARHAGLAATVGGPLPEYAVKTPDWTRKAVPEEDTFQVRAAAVLDPRDVRDWYTLRALRSHSGRAIGFLLNEGVRHQVHLDALEPAIDSILAGPKPSMIVCGNDDFAWACVAHLRQRGVRVPEDISVAGFDDTLESFLNGLTSYNFNSEGAAQGMLNHILAPPRGPNRSTRRRVVEVKGYVNLRATTAAIARN